jgi:hypothetical protein
MPTARSASTDASQSPTVNSNQWKKHLPYLYSITSPSISVRQTVHENEKRKDTNLLLVTRSDGVHKIGYLPNEEKDFRLEDDTEARQAYLCKLGSVLAAKLGLSSGGNKPKDAFWDALPEVLFGYEIFERARAKVAGGKASDIYVVGHPIEGSVPGLFRTPEEFAQHLLWLAEGNREKVCICVLCTKEAKKKGRGSSSRSTGDMVKTWKQECHDRAKSYLSSTTLGSFWGDLPDLNGHGTDFRNHDEQ